MCAFVSSFIFPLFIQSPDGSECLRKCDINLVKTHIKSLETNIKMLESQLLEARAADSAEAEEEENDVRAEFQRRLRKAQVGRVVGSEG